jgi:quercetin dioxygenase-like cupin family protein
VITSEGCVVIHAAEGHPVKGAAGAETLVKATGPETGMRLEAFEQVAPKGSGPPLHIHRDCAETFYVIEGVFRFEVGAEPATATAGTLVFVPKGVPHTYTNVGTTDGRLLFWFNPAARMAAYFEELAMLSPGSRSDRAIDEIAARHGVEMVREVKP